MRNFLYSILEVNPKSGEINHVYHWFMFGCIVISILPLMTTVTYPFFKYTEAFTVIVFIIDYVLRWMVADKEMGKGKKSFLLYPFTFMAIVDLLSILPGINLLSPSFKIFRLSRMLKIIRLFKIFHYSSKINIFIDVLKKERQVLFSVLLVALFYIFLTALIMFNAEPHVDPETGEPTFVSFFDALYWATVTLTTVGYGDLCPVTDLGRFISMLSSLFGVAIIALPSGVITASYLDELRKKNAKRTAKHTEDKKEEVTSS